MTSHFDIYCSLCWLNDCSIQDIISCRIGLCSKPSSLFVCLVLHPDRFLPMTAAGALMARVTLPFTDLSTMYYSISYTHS